MLLISEKIGHGFFLDMDGKFSQLLDLIETLACNKSTNSLLLCKESLYITKMNLFKNYMMRISSHCIS